MDSHTLLRVLFLPGSHSRRSRWKIFRLLFTAGPFAPGSWRLPITQTDPPKIQRDFGRHLFDYNLAEVGWRIRTFPSLHFSLRCCWLAGTGPKTRHRDETRHTHTQPQPNSFFCALHTTLPLPPPLAGFHFFTLEGGEIFFHPNFFSFGCQSPLDGKMHFFPRSIGAPRERKAENATG